MNCRVLLKKRPGILGLRGRISWNQTVKVRRAFSAISLAVGAIDKSLDGRLLL
jgi:hypothetical protein